VGAYVVTVGAGSGKTATIGQRILAVLEAQHRSQRWLALRVGLDRSSLSRLTRGEITSPRVKHLEAIASALGVSPSTLTGTTSDWYARSDQEGELEGQESASPRGRRLTLVDYSQDGAVEHLMTAVIQDDGLAPLVPSNTRVAFVETDVPTPGALHVVRHRGKLMVSWYHGPHDGRPGGFSQAPGRCLSSGTTTCLGRVTYILQPPPEPLPG